MHLCKHVAFSSSLKTKCRTPTGILHPFTMRYFPTLALSKSGCGLKHLLTLSPSARAPHFVSDSFEPPSIITSPLNNASISSILRLFFFQYDASFLLQLHHSLTRHRPILLPAHADARISLSLPCHRGSAVPIYSLCRGSVSHNL